MFGQQLTVEFYMNISVSRSMGGVGAVVLVAIGIFIDRNNLTNTDLILLGICLLLNSIGITIGELVDLKRVEIGGVNGRNNF